MGKVMASTIFLQKRLWENITVYASGFEKIYKTL